MAAMCAISINSIRHRPFRILFFLSIVVIALLAIGGCGPSTPELTPTVVASASSPEDSSVQVTPASPTSQMDPGGTFAFVTPTSMPPVPSPIPATPAPSLPQPVAYTVQPGETMLELALRYDLPMAAIQLQNQMGASTALLAGQELSIPPAAEWEGRSPFWVVHEVVEGETMLAIAEDYVLDLDTLITVNGIPDSNWLTIGQPLIIPLDVPIEALAQLAANLDPVADVPAVEEAAVEAPVAGEPVAEAAAATAEPDLSAILAAVPASGDASAEVFALINAVRAERGLPPYTYNETLAQAAYLHGLDCQQRGFCNHVGSDGANVTARVVRTGYPAVGAAECIVYSASPQEAVAWWMDEVPPNDWHVRTLLSTWVTEIGIAVVPNNVGSYYFIADFGRPATP